MSQSKQFCLKKKHKGILKTVTGYVVVVDSGSGSNTRNFHTNTRLPSTDRDINYFITVELQMNFALGRAKKSA